MYIIINLILKTLLIEIQRPVVHDSPTVKLIQNNNEII